jgi:DNA primase
VNSLRVTRIPLGDDHRDRDEILACADIEEIAEYCGFRRGRYKAWHCGFHDDRTPSASIRGRRIRCFGECGRSWDIFELIQQAHGVDFRGALAWLADHYGVPVARPLTHSERQDYARLSAAATREAADLVQWRDGLLGALRYARDQYLGTYHRSKNYIIRNGLGAPFGNLAADAGEHYLLANQRLDKATARIEGAEWGFLLDYYRRTKHAEAA